MASTSSENYKVIGMTCASCAVSLESYLKKVRGVESVAVNYPNQTVFIVFDKDKVTEHNLNDKAIEIGYELILGDKKEVQKVVEKKEVERLKLLKSKLLFSLAFSTPVFVMAMFFMGELPYENWILMCLSIPVLFWSGSEFFVIAWRRIKVLQTNMDTLVALSTGVAFVFSVFNTINPKFFTDQGLKSHVYFESSVVIITLILLGRFLEEKAKTKTSFAIKK